MTRIIVLNNDENTPNNATIPNDLVWFSYSTSARHERHECNTTDRNDTSATRRKNFDFDNDTSENIFTPPY